MQTKTPSALMSGRAPASESARNPVLLREFSLRAAFSLAFAFISPIVALYSIFALGLAASGPSFWLAFPIALTGQLLVALVLAMLVSRFPLEGSVYQWSRELGGARYGWFAGWTYICTLIITMAAVSLGGASYLAQLIGLNPNNGLVTILLALVMLGFATWGNTRGRHVLSTMVLLCVLAELIGSVGVGTWLLLTARVQSFSLIFTTPHLFTPSPGLLGIFDSKAAAGVALCGWAFVGFESAGSIAEEVKDPSRNIPRAMLGSLIFVAAVVSFSCLALMLAVPNITDVIAGNSADPVADTLVYHLGPLLYRFLLVFFVIGYLACLLGVQASASRVIWAFARNGELPFAQYIVDLSGPDRQPVRAVVITGIFATSLFALASTHLYVMLVAFTAAGFYIAFGFPVFAAGWAMLRGSWKRTPFHLGALTGLIAFCAAFWLLFEIVNIAWPRVASAPWYESWSVVLMFSFLAGLGLFVRYCVDRNA
jgi:amino acid transporter